MPKYTLKSHYVVELDTPWAPDGLMDSILRDDWFVELSDSQVSRDGDNFIDIMIPSNRSTREDWVIKRSDLIPYDDKRIDLSEIYPTEA